MINDQEDLPEWRAAPAYLPNPSSCNWDVIISHAGNSADKPFAHALVQLLGQTGWGLRIFLDSNSLLPGGAHGSVMLQAIESTEVAVLLLSKEYFKKVTAMSELTLLLERHALRNVQLLPVFLRMTLQECEGELSTLLQPGAAQFTLLAVCKLPMDLFLIEGSGMCYRRATNP